MKKDNNLSKDPTDEEEIFDLSLDDLSEADINIASDNGEPNEEIIELMDLVEKGNKDLKFSDEDVTLSYDDYDQPTRDINTVSHGASPAERKAPHEEVPLSETDLVLANISLESDISLLQEDEDGTAGKRKDLDEGEIENMLKEETDLSLDETIHSPIVSSETAEPVQKTELEKSEAVIELNALTRPPVKEIPAISEEKLEAVVKKVVEDVVERVARETMSNVAERVIREAIDSLKQSLEKDSE
jgi:hypothetical protein